MLIPVKASSVEMMMPIPDARQRGCGAAGNLSNFTLNLTYEILSDTTDDSVLLGAQCAT